MPSACSPVQLSSNLINSCGALCITSGERVEFCKMAYLQCSHAIVTVSYLVRGSSSWHPSPLMDCFSNFALLAVQACMQAPDVSLPCSTLQHHSHDMLVAHAGHQLCVRCVSCTKQKLHKIRQGTATLLYVHPLNHEASSQHTA